MRQLLDRRVLPIAILTLFVWVAGALLAGEWMVLRGQVPSLLAEVEQVELPEAAPTLPEIPFDRGPTCAPLTLRLVRICEEAGVDTFSYVASLADAEPIDPAILEFLRNLESSGSDADAGTIRREHVVLSTKSRYRRIRELLGILETADPPLGLRRLELRSSRFKVEMEVELVGLCLEI